EDVSRLEAAVRQPRDRRTDAALGVRIELVAGGLDARAAAPFAELVEPPPRQTVRGQLRPEISAPLVGVPRLRDELLEDLVIEARGRDHDTFLLEAPRLGREAPGLTGADVGVMRARDGEADLCPRHERDVGQ